MHRARLPAVAFMVGLSFLPSAASAAAIAWIRTPSPTYSGEVREGSYNQNRLGFPPLGPANRVTRLGTGKYLVTLTSYGTDPDDGGHVQVTATGTSNVRCQVSGWASGAVDTQATVYCHLPGGTAADGTFALWYVRHEGGLTVGYAWAHLPTTADYTALPLWATSPGGDVTIRRFSTGYYAVTFPGTTSQGRIPHVTAYGSDGSYCKPVVWSGNTVFVRCFDATGILADRRYTVIVDRGTNVVESGGHVWVNSLSTAWFTPSNQYNTFGGVNTARWSGNSALVRYPSLYEDVVRSAMVTASGLDAAYCKLDAITADNTASTRCFDALGVPTKSSFTQTFQATRQCDTWEYEIGVVNAGASACTSGDGLGLRNGESCSVGCSPGYTSGTPSGLGWYTCSHGLLEYESPECTPL